MGSGSPGVLTVGEPNLISAVYIGRGQANLHQPRVAMGIFVELLRLIRQRLVCQ